MESKVSRLEVFHEERIEIQSLMSKLRRKYGQLPRENDTICGIYEGHIKKLENEIEKMKQKVYLLERRLE